MNKREIIEGLLDEFELLVTQYQYELSKSDDENDAMSRMTSEAIRVTRQRIVNEATTALSTDRQSGCSNESTKDGSRE